MTAKIKLNAASGGGSFSLQAPSSSSNNRVLTLPDAADGIVAQTDSSGNFSVSGTTTCTGNLKVGTITDTSGNNSSTTAQIAQGRAKAWVTYNSSATIQDSFGVSSVTDTATGDKTVNFSTNFSNINYAVSTMASEQDNGSFSLVEEDSRAVGSCRIVTRTSRTSGKANFDLVCAIFFGDN